MQLITSVDDFRANRKAGKGYFVITDTANPTRIHDVRCSYVTEDRFTEKVITNSSKNGKYIWVERHDDASQFGAVPCSGCL